MLMGSKIKELREQHGMTQRDLANTMQVTPSAVSAWEGGRNSPPIDAIKKMTHLFSVTIEELIGNDYYGASAKISKISNDFLEEFNKLNEENKEFIRMEVRNKLEEQRYNDLTRIPIMKITDVAISGVVSAGTGEYNEETFGHQSVEFYGNVPDKYSFAALVNGDSMEPMFHDKEVIFVNDCKEASNGQIIIAHYDNEFFVKKFVQDSTGSWLVSLNPAYKKMPINDEHPLKIYGIVL